MEYSDKIFPITFSIPEEKVIVDKIPTKTKMQSDLIPGDPSTYIYDTEEAYYNEYRSSIFALTVKKSGWDCMRHYEIIANGAIPVFPNIDKCPENIMTHYPKHLSLIANDLYNKLKGKQLGALSIKEKGACLNLIVMFLEWMKSHLTCVKMAEYILCKINPLNSPIKRILFLCGCLIPDYIRCCTLIGLKKIFGSNCHDYPKIPHIYKNHGIQNTSLYGKGMSYTSTIDSDCRNDSNDLTIEDDIKNRKYDIIIYGSYHRGMPYINLVHEHYENDKVVMICGEDTHKCSYVIWAELGHYVFVRELRF